jgi:hypothetical protein
MEPEDPNVEKIKQQIEKLQGYQNFYKEAQAGMPYINQGIDQLTWTKGVLQSPYGNIPSIKEGALEVVRGWETLPPAPSFGTQGVTGPYAIGTSACSSVVGQIHVWRFENKPAERILDPLEVMYHEMAQANLRNARIAEGLKFRNQTLSNLFEEALRYYNAWKANPGDSRALLTAMRNVLEKFKGHLNLISCEFQGVEPRSEVSWNKVFQAIGTENNQDLLKQKTVHEKLWGDLSQSLKANIFPTSQEIELSFSQFIDHIDSVIHLLDRAIKSRFFGIGI